MRLVFLNSLEKEGRDLVAARAKVWIGEEEGIWRMGWSELVADDEQETQWYEGTSWSEMLHVYRHNLVVKLGEGYRPVIEGIWGEQEQLQGRGMFSQRLVCYSELHENKALYDELVQWRKNKASAMQRAPFIIASNRLLRLISVFCPRTMEELLQLPGVGSTKAGQFGAEILAMTKDQERFGDFPLNWVRDEVDEETFRSWIYKQKEMKLKSEMDRFCLRRNVLESIAAGMNLDGMCSKWSLDRKDAVELLEQLDKEGYSVESFIQRELHSVPQEVQDRIWRAYEELGDTLLKPVLQRVYRPEELEGLPLDPVYEQLRLLRILFRQRTNSAMTPKAV